MPTVEEVVRKYIELRDRKAELAKKHQAELAPFNQGMETMEGWLLNQMNELGASSIPTPAGTPYKANSNSLWLEDPRDFKLSIFEPAVVAIYHYLSAVGHSLQPADVEAINASLLEKASWDMVDFRAGKKGILEYQEAHDKLPPGVVVETTTVVNVRRS